MTDANNVPPPSAPLPPLDAVPMPPDRLPGGMLALLGVAGFLYAIMMSNLLPDPNTDLAGRGLAQAFAMFAGLALWPVLAILLLVGAVQGKMPVGGLAFVILLPLSGVASAIAVGLARGEVDWLLFVPGLVPPLVAFYAMWARLPLYRDRLPPLKTTLVICLAMLALSATPFVAQHMAPDPQQVAKAAAEQQALARKQMELEAASPGAKPAAKAAPSPAGFERLGPGSSLGDYLPYLSGPYAKTALKDVRQVKTRQADAVTLLKQGHLGALSHLSEFDVRATPELCQAYGEALTVSAKALDPKANPDNYLADAIVLQEQIPNLQWLAGEHCDLDAPVSVLELNVRLLAEPKLARFADALGKLRKGR